jgi:cyclopropane fatty-acyl-phospholipid synthase-like methyltransferase
MKQHFSWRWGVFAAVAALMGFFFRFFGRKKEVKTDVVAAHTSNDVRDFYNRYTDKFLQVYGEVIQAFRTKDVSKLLAYEMESMGLEAGNEVLDAGCGVGAPAIYFAQQLPVQIEAVTISDVQAKQAQKCR